MTRFLVATVDVHTTAAACDYLQERLDAADAVWVLAVTGGELDARDAADAMNVAGVRLSSAGSVERVTRDGDPAAAILALAEDVDAEEIVVAVRGEDPSTSGNGVGTTIRQMLPRAGCPVVVVPVDRPE